MARRRVAIRVESHTDASSVARVVKRLAMGNRPVGPVIAHFAGKLAQSVDFDFRVGGRAPSPWAANKPNTVAGKRHGRVLQGASGSGIQRGMRYVVSSGGRSAGVQVFVPFPGMLHHRGVKKTWEIRPKKASALAFIVAGAGGSVRKGLRHSGGLVFARKVTHPGLPRRPIVVVRDGLLREGWRHPLRAFLFSGIVPSAPRHSQVAVL